MRKVFLTLLFVCAALSGMFAQQRKEINLKTWEFSRDKVAWENVCIPHDWAIAGPFDKKWDLQRVAIVQNGEKQATEKSGRSGALPWIGEGHYKCTVQVPKEIGSAAWGRAVLEFDGAMAEPRVKVNGTEAGYWPYGYNAFRLDVTSLLHAGDNLIEVDLQNVEESSRWYPGAGLYRPVKLVLTGKTALDAWATSIRTTALTEGVDNHGETEPQAIIDYQTEVKGIDGDVACVVEILSDKGAFEAGCHVDVEADGKVHSTFNLGKPHLWTPETPYLYKVRTRLFRDHKLIDEMVTPFGVRTVSVSKEGGFQLNGVTRKIQGVCLHHDLGPLGSAVNKAALIRQIRIMKDMGCDAIRTSHNMPSTLQMEVCDSMGMMVMAESFDMWIYPKCKNGYARFFKDWAEKDITNLVLNHRNHPSIVMWSIGNEIPEQGDKKAGVEWATKLQDLCHQLDPTRPVTQGIDRVDNALASGFAEVMDVVGLNYRTHKYDKAYRTTSKGFILGSETASTVSSRGVYKLPYRTTNRGVYPDGQCSGYDNEWCSWSNLPDVDFENMDDLPWTIGQFVWTGIDYLGEPTPYDEYWPSRSSYFGICDLAGLPKDRYYLYRSVWNKADHTLHIAPHWTWGKDMIGKNVPVQVYTDYDEAELFINGKSQGRIKKQKDVNRNAEGKQITGTEAANPNSDKWDPSRDTSHAPNLDRYRLRWMNTTYEPGELKVVAYDNDGKVAKEEILLTAGEASQFVLSADKTTLTADGNDLSYITVSLCDANGTLCPDAMDDIEVSVEGTGTFKAVCNGDATSVESFVQPHMKLFHGQLVVTVQSKEVNGVMKVTIRRPAKVTGTGKKQKVLAPEIVKTIELKTVGAPKLTAQSFDIDLWQNGLPNSNGIDKTEPYSVEKRNFKPGIRVFLPEESKRTGMAVLVIPGGGYRVLSNSYEGYNWADYLTKEGIATIVLSYRMPRGVTDVPVSDATEAMRLIRENASKWGIDPHKVGVLGSSAGGHLASTIATHNDKATRPDFQILFYPVISMDKAYTHMDSHNCIIGENASKALEDAYSNQLQVKSDTPPAIILLSDDDALVPPRNSAEYYLALKKAGVKAAIHSYPSGGHGWGCGKFFKYHDAMLTDLTDWLKAL